MNKNKYYDYPTQVLFYDTYEDEHRLLGGIAYENYIICGECGSTVPMEDAVIIKEFSWVDISDAIIGDDVQENS